MKDIINFKNIDKRFYGVHALKDVSMSIRKSEIHAIVGENGAGKSTLMNILSGVISADKGEILLNGESVDIKSPHVAKELGIATVYQETKLCQNMNATENIFMGCELRKKGGGLDWTKMHQTTKELLECFNVDIDIKAPLSKLTIAENQIIEIARALNVKAEILILDEPTSSLTTGEIQGLFRNLNDLKAKGMTILFISHRLAEVIEIADRMSVMRNGEYICTKDTEGLSRNEIVNLITGKQLNYGDKCKTSDCITDEVVMKAEGITWKDKLKDISFKLNKGEILGFYGIQGSGRTELMNIICGVEKPDSGDLYICDKKVKNFSPKEAIKNKVGYVTEDRKNLGIFARMNINENISIIHDKMIANALGLLREQKRKQISEQYVEKLNVKVSSLQQLISQLSGGNQQKAIIARSLSTNPEILVLDEPTKGIDIGAKSEVYAILKELREEGLSIIFVSSEIEEVINEADRIIVLHNGSISGEVLESDMNEKNVLMHAFGNKTQ